MTTPRSPVQNQPRYLHANKIVHRDLKLENFIFTSKETDADIKLIDFGFSRQYLETETTKMTNLVGTCYYLAPEVINKAYTEAAGDISFETVCTTYGRRIRLRREIG